MNCIDVNLDPESYLLFYVFYTAWTPAEENLSVAMYMEKFKRGFAATGHALEWLGLAVPDKESHLGWKPTRRLMPLIATGRSQLPKSRKKCASKADQDTFETIFDAVPNDIACGQGGYVLSVLGVLRLVRCADNGDDVPTQRLRELVAERRLEERSQRHEQEGQE